MLLRPRPLPTGFNLPPRKTCAHTAIRAEIFLVDRERIRHALSLAKRGLGHTYPNPAVGCVIYKGEQVGGICHAGKASCAGELL